MPVQLAVLEQEQIRPSMPLNVSVASQVVFLWALPLSVLFASLATLHRAHLWLVSVVRLDLILV